MKTLIAIIFTASLLYGQDIRITDQATVKPNKIGNIDNPNRETLLAHGWRYTTELPPVAEGYERGQVRWEDADGTNAAPVYVDTLTQDRIDREAREAYANDLQDNGSQYVLENQYILLCDSLRQILGQAPDQTAIHEDAFPVMLLTLKKASEPTYNTLRDAFALITGKLVTYNLKWMDSVCWHPQPELQAASMQILELVK